MVLPSVLFFVYGVLVYKIQGITRSAIFEEILDKTLKVPFSIKEP